MMGIISSVGEIKQKSNGKEGMYINIAINSKEGESSFYPLYLDGKILDTFREKGLKKGDLISFVGKAESFKRESGTTIHFRPFELEKIEKNKEKNTSETREMEV